MAGHLAVAVPRYSGYLYARQKALAAAGGVMAPPLAHEGGTMLSFGPTFDVKGKR